MMSAFTFSPEAVPEPVRRLQDILGPELFAVGGMIRDTVDRMLRSGTMAARESEGSDWDLATPLRPEVVMRRLRKAGITVAPVGLDHGTVMAVIDEERYEITTYRHDLEYIDGRHCIVRFADDIVEDLARRDFTVNAMAMDLRDLTVVDPFGGLEDLPSRLIRTVGNPDERFAEDHLRLIRAARFAARLDGEVESGTLQAMAAHAEKIRYISVERIRDELLKLCSYPGPSIGLRILRDTGLLRHVLPELDECFGVAQNRHHSHDVGEHTLLATDALHPRFPFLRFIMLLHDTGKPGCRRWIEERGDYVFYGHQNLGAELARDAMRRLRFSNVEIDFADRMVSNHMAKLQGNMTAATARRLVRRIGREHIRDFLRMRIADRRGNLKKKGRLEDGLCHFVRLLRKIERQEDALRVEDLRVNGRDLIAMGLKPGPLFGEVIDSLLDRVLDDPALNERAMLLDLLIARLEEQGVEYDASAAAALRESAAPVEDASGGAGQAV